MLDFWIMIDIYLIPINQLLTQRCGRNSCYTRAILLFFRGDVITSGVVDKLYKWKDRYVSEYT